MKNFRMIGFQTCAFCSNLGKYITNGKFYCRKDSSIDFDVSNSSEQNPNGFVCEEFSEGRIKENENGIRDSDQTQHQT